MPLPETEGGQTDLNDPEPVKEDGLANLPCV